MISIHAQCDESIQQVASVQECTSRVDVNTLAPEEGSPRWCIRNRCYYWWLNCIFQSAVRPNARVLYVGCEGGDLLAAGKPRYGLGIDSDTAAIASARRRFPQLHFEVRDPHDFHLDGTFDYVLIANSLEQWRDIQKVFDNIHRVTSPDTRIVIACSNHLRETIRHLGSWLRTSRPLPYQNRLSTTDIVNQLYLSGFELIRTASYLMLPRRIPLLAPMCNHILSMLPGFRRLNLITLLIARPIPQAKDPSEVSVSVIVPTRNERGNVAAAVARIPKMGRRTEIIFVDGASTDGTVAEIERQIREQPSRNIRLIHQGGALGKGDAVRKGFDVAQGDVLVIQDADLTAPPEDLPKFFRAWCEGKGEFINGSRLVYPLERQAMRFLNLLGNKFFGALFSWLLGQRFRDTLCGTKMLSRTHYEWIAAHRGFFSDFDPFGDFDLIFGAARQNLKIVEIPVRYQARTYGETNIRRFRHGWLLLRMSWVAFKKIKWLCPA